MEAALAGMDKSDQPLDKEEKPHVSSSVERWVSRIKQAKRHWQCDFERMRKNMEFATGFQWDEQAELDDDRYVANLTLRMVNQKVATLYARDPKMKAQRRRRMDFQLWDGRIESIQQSAALLTGEGVDEASKLSALALQADYTMGRQQRDIIDKIGQTLEHVYQWQIDNQEPGFKEQMKQLVRRVIITGVGYVRVHFSRGHESVLTTSDTEMTTADRLGRAQDIMRRLADGTLDKDSHEVLELASIMQGVMAGDPDEQSLDERLIFDFPTATSIIPDTACRQLKGFVGARWVAQEFVMTLDEVNAHFGTTLDAASGLTQYTKEGTEDTPIEVSDPNDPYQEPQRCCVWEVFDHGTKTCFFVLDGYKEYLREPEPVYPHLKRFWSIFPLTFNDVEVEPGQKASVFPPSDVQLLRPAQKEWNRTREELRKHRNANRPKYMTAKGWLTERDKEKLADCESSAVIELEGTLGPNDDIGKKLAPFNHAAIDPTIYDTAPLVQDVFHALGNEEATQPSSTKATATAATINEQSRLIVTSSNVDDLDDLLSNLGEAASEILLREMSAENVKRIAGHGGVWPEEAEAVDFINYVFLKVVAASSGRPNKALEIANFQQLAPIMLQAGASPAFVLGEAIKRLDDRLDIDEIFPYGVQQAMAMVLPQEGAQQQSTNPARGANTPTRSGQAPAGAVPRPSVERPNI